MFAGAIRSWMLVGAGMVAMGAALSGCGGSSSSGASSAAAALNPGAAVSPGTTPSAPAAAAGTAIVNWQAPTENIDGTPITGLSGFNIYYGTQSQNYTTKIQVTNPGLATYVVDNLPPGVYFIAVTAYDAQGSESDYSPEVATQVN